MKQKLLLILTGFLILLVSSCSNKIDSTEDMVDKIVEKYNGKWFKQITFSQTTTFYRNDSAIKTEKWVEEYSFPSQLIIKVDDRSGSKGQLYRNDSVYIFENNEVTFKSKSAHDIVILSLDIYNMSKDQIMSRLKELNYDINKFREDTYNGRKIYVIGADKGDLTSNQIWYDAENLLFLRMIKNTPQGLQEVTFNDYINIEGQGWIEQEILFKVDGKLYLIEKYYDIKIPDVQNSEISISDFKSFNLNINQSIKYIIDYSIFNSGKKLIVLISDNL